MQSVASSRDCRVVMENSIMSFRPVVCMFAAVLAFLAASATFAQTPPAATPAPPSPAAPPATPPPTVPAQPTDPFGEEVTLPARTIVFKKGTGSWDSAFETLLKALKVVNAFLDKQGIKPAGPAMTIYTQTDDVGFQFQAAVPIAETPKTPPRGELALGKSPDGKMLKFVHRGSYDAMDTTYEAITNYLDEKRLEAKDMFIEEYVTDPAKTPEDKLVVNVYVPIK
jgi:effector-binding domain-containing protein